VCLGARLTDWLEKLAGRITAEGGSAGSHEQRPASWHGRDDD
jgi:hypothetical protein